MARGSAYEVAAVLDVAERLGVVRPTVAERGRGLVDEIGAMLFRFR